MKLNFRNVEAGGSLAHGVTPILIPSIAGVAQASNSAPSTAYGALPDSDPSKGSGLVRQASQAPLRPTPRRCPMCLGTGILYLLGVLVVLSLPFVLPVAVSHAVRIIDSTQNNIHVPTETTEFPKFQAEDDLTGPPASTSPTQNKNHDQAGLKPLMPNAKGSTILPSTLAPDPLFKPIRKPPRIDPASSRHGNPVSAMETIGESFVHNPVASKPLLTENTAPARHADASRSRRREVYRRSRTHPATRTADTRTRTSTHPTHDVRRTSPAIPTVSSNSNKQEAEDVSGASSLSSRKNGAKAFDRLEPISDQWSKFTIVRHGNLYLSETFEARLNEQVAQKLFEQHPEIFGEIQRDCGGKPDISFSFKSSPRIEAELEIVMQCGPIGSSCTLRPLVDDLRRLHVNVGPGRSGGHFLQADATTESAGVSWGPLEGPLTITLREGSMMALKKTCVNEEATATRILSVGQVKQMMRDIEGTHRAVVGGVEEGQGMPFNVFKYDAHPHHHIQNEKQGEGEARALDAAVSTGSGGLARTGFGVIGGRVKTSAVVDAVGSDQIEDGKQAGNVEELDSGVETSSNDRGLLRTYEKVAVESRSTIDAASESRVGERRGQSGGDLRWRGAPLGQQGHGARVHLDRP